MASRRVPIIAAFIVGCAATAAATQSWKSGNLSSLTGGGGQDRAAQQSVISSLEKAPPAARPGSGSEQPRNAIATAAARVEPAVVTVHTVGRAIPVASGGGNPMLDDPFFRQFFGGSRGGGGGGGGMPMRQMVPRGAGSGVIISDEGYILTNNHVVAGAARVTVNVGDKGYDARVIGADEASDIAVVKIDAKGAKLPVAELGNSDDIHVGDWALAIGNPLDVGTTVTLGIISALNRKDLHAEGHALHTVIQTDAAVNPGNSGGALANIDGQVIGINEAILSPTGSSVGIGFAIPINDAKKIAAELIKSGKIVRPYLGVGYAPLKSIPADARRQVGITANGDDGVVVTQVAPGSPADRAGLRVYDVILEANRQKLTDAGSLGTIIGKEKVGDSLDLLVSRGGQTQTMTVRLAERPATYGQESSAQEQPPSMMPDQP